MALGAKLIEPGGDPEVAPILPKIIFFIVEKIF
jgi:hypothetical protein